jgi:hypothetical protein
LQFSTVSLEKLDDASFLRLHCFVIRPAEELIQVSTRGSTDYHFIEPTKGEPLRLP